VVESAFDGPLLTAIDIAITDAPTNNIFRMTIAPTPLLRAPERRAFNSNRRINFFGKCRANRYLYSALFISKKYLSDLCFRYLHTMKTDMLMFA
jgi:hypothetical protein